jgi:hypothetical protein
MATIDRPLSGVTDVLGLTRYHHLAEQIKETIALYEMTSKDARLDESSETLRKLINGQARRLRDLDSKAGRIPSYTSMVLILLGAALLLVVTISLIFSDLPSTLTDTGAAISSLTFVIYFAKALEVFFRQEKSEIDRVSP